MVFINTSGGFLLIWTAIFFGLGIIKWSRLTQLMNGSLIDATIIEHTPDTYFAYGVENHAPQNYMITFRYKFDDMEYTATQFVSKNQFIQWQDGNILAARCLPNNPRKVFLAENYKYRKQKYSKVRALLTLGIIGALLLMLEIYLVVIFIK